jgi:hydrogenase maturation protein HypF
MQLFKMCNVCGQEYRQTGDRRCHAQTIACRDCGPQLILQQDETCLHEDDALQRAIELLLEGQVLAVKGIGGYQFACLPEHPKAAEHLRLLKHREKKPFAVMFPDIDKLKQYCEVSEPEEVLLCSSARPIVLLKA